MRWGETTAIPATTDGEPPFGPGDQVNFHCSAGEERLSYIVERVSRGDNDNGDDDDDDDDDDDGDDGDEKSVDDDDRHHHHHHDHDHDDHDDGVIGRNLT